MAGRPRIGVCGPDCGGLAAWIFTALAVWRAGGWPVRIAPGRNCGPCDDLEGLILGGGADVDPGRYGEAFEGLLEDLRVESRRERALGWRIFVRLFYPLLLGLRLLLGRRKGPEASRLDKDRDELEFGLLGRALERNLPVLGICRGEQLLNVYYGGRLLRDVRPFAEETPHRRSLLPRKKVVVAPGSRLAAALGRSGRLRVNAMHEQAVCCLGQGLRAVAEEPSGIIQAVEDPARPFVVGVQWHPEFLPQLRTQQGLFRALVAEAGRRAGR